MTKTKHVPIRMCAVCRERQPWNLLIRHVAAKQDGKALMLPDQGKKQPGRGFYLCSSTKCQNAFARKYSGRYSG